MIDWISVLEEKPKLDKNPHNGSQMSVKVLAWVKFTPNDVEEFPRFAHYSHRAKYWIIDGCMGNGFVVTHFAYIDKPKK